jgi:hypothetical protein
MRVKILGTIMLCSIILLGTISCGGISEIDGMTGDELLDRVIAADDNIYTCKLLLNAKIDMMGISMSMDGHGAMDRNAKEMSLDMGDIMSVYIVDDWMYMNESFMGWVKMELTDDIWEENDQIGGQLEMLEQYVDVKILGTEQVMGSECYVVEVIPDLQALWDWAMEEEGMEGFDIDIDIEEMIKEFTVKVWIEKGTFYMTQVSINMVMEMLGEKMTMLETVTLYDINQPVSIYLPYEAQDAVEWNMSSWDTY